MRRIRILIFGGPTYLAAEVSAAWNKAGVELIGPMASFELPVADDGIADGAIIDIDLDTEALLVLSDALEAVSIPSVFATASPVAGNYRGFELAVTPTAIDSILRALLGSGGIRTH